MKLNGYQIVNEAIISPKTTAAIHGQGRRVAKFLRRLTGIKRARPKITSISSQELMR